MLDEIGKKMRKRERERDLEKTKIETKRESMVSRAVHGSGQVGFGPDPDSTHLNRVT